MDGTRIAALAERLTGTDWGDSTDEAGEQAVAERFGWAWSVTPGGPRAATGLAADGARVDRIVSTPWGGEEFAELAVPVLRPGGAALGHARAFRYAAGAVRGVLGHPDTVGSYGTTDPYGRRTGRRCDWGAPHLRREGVAGGRRVLELTAGADGPEFLLRSGSRLFAMRHHWRYEAELRTGFTGTGEDEDDDADEEGRGTRRNGRRGAAGGRRRGPCGRRGPGPRGEREDEHRGNRGRQDPATGVRARRRGHRGLFPVERHCRGAGHGRLRTPRTEQEIRSSPRNNRNRPALRGRVAGGPKNRLSPRSGVRHSGRIAPDDQEGARP
ncbi:hypothetical protein [Kitasatospora sp. KL5]|uniref:hypothetical protein n=1 Tax=Kitasatospora sp. KL5 TaxID=3425125 RepID=UPI003D6F9509